MRRATDWIVIYDGSDGKGMRFACLRCGDVYLVTVPVEVSMLAAMGKAFGKLHRGCAKPKDAKR